MKLLAILAFCTIIISVVSESERKGDEVKTLEGAPNAETIGRLRKMIETRDMIGNIHPSRRPSRTPSHDE